MSYKRSYSHRIEVPYSGTISYPASKSGGSIAYEGTAYEDVDVIIDIDTGLFDEGVTNCITNVSKLTEAIGATEAAQIDSINTNTEKIARTIINGFFKATHAEISRQIAELLQKVDAHLVLLRELAKSCIAKQKQMETDYNRISSRYLKIFNDLNSELKNRVFEMNKPAFTFKSSIDINIARTTNNDLVDTVAVFGTEEGGLNTKIGASIVKKRVWDTIKKVNEFLWKQKKINSTINRNLLNEKRTAKRYLPVCYIESCNEKNQLEKNVYQPDFSSKVNPGELITKFKSHNWAEATQEKKEAIQRYFYMELNRSYTAGNPHDNRVKEMIASVFDINFIKCNNT